MLVNGKHFPGSTFYVDTQNTLRSIAGNASMFTEFVPVHFPNIRTFHKLLFHFYRHGLCCFVTSSFFILHSGFPNSFPGCYNLYGFGSLPSDRLFNFSSGTACNSTLYNCFFILNIYKRFKLLVPTGCVWVLLTRSCTLSVSMPPRVVTTAQTLISFILFGIIFSDILLENLPLLFFHRTT